MLNEPNDASYLSCNDDNLATYMHDVFIQPAAFDKYYKTTEIHTTLAAA